VTPNDDRDKPDPRSPVQPASSNAPYFILAAVAAVALWGAQHDWTRVFEQPVAAPGEKQAPAAAPRQASPPEAPRSDLRTLFSGDDYPVEAQRNGEEGTVQARLAIGIDGRVARCTIIRSSGYASLDDATCNILQKRARFTPARDNSFAPVGDTVITPPVTWRLAD